MAKALPKAMSRQLSVKLPKDYKTKFERLNSEYNLGYGSFPEFIKDCMRRRFEELIGEYGDEPDSNESN